MIEFEDEGIDLVYSSVSYSLAGQHIERLTLSGSAAVNATGNSLANIVTGNGAANEINGGGGNDQLFGGGGRDRFVFDTALSATANADRIGDYSVADDTIALDRSVFTKLGEAGALSSDAFHAGSAAHDSSDRIIYDQGSGNIFYDADGSGGAAGSVLFASLTPGLSLTAADFHVVL